MEQAAVAKASALDPATEGRSQLTASFSESLLWFDVELGATTAAARLELLVREEKGAEHL